MLYKSGNTLCQVKVSWMDLVATETYWITDCLCIGGLLGFFGSLGDKEFWNSHNPKKPSKIYWSFGFSFPVKPGLHEFWISFSLNCTDIGLFLNPVYYFWFYEQYEHVHATSTVTSSVNYTKLMDKRVCYLKWNDAY